MQLTRAELYGVDSFVEEKFLIYDEVLCHHRLNPGRVERRRSQLAVFNFPAPQQVGRPHDGQVAGVHAGHVMQGGHDAEVVDYVLQRSVNELG